jgi:hypothetical protein
VPTTEKPAAARITDAFEDVIAGYSMVFRCEHVSGCDNEVEWYGNQHGCVQAYICDDHMTEYALEVTWELDSCGFVICRPCQRAFASWESFISVRPI